MSFQVEVIGSGQAREFEVDAIVPATEGFPYWTLYIAGVDSNNNKQCRHISEKIVSEIVITEPEGGEVKNATIRKNEMPDVLRDYRATTE